MLMIRQLIRRFMREQDGVALVLAIAATSVLAIATTGVIVAGTANETTAFGSSQGRAAYEAAQQALADGEGWVYAEVAAGTNPPNDTPQTVPTQPNGATGSYSVHSDDGVTWLVTANATSGGVSRTVSVYVTPAQTVTTQQLAIWNYLYEDSNNNSSVSGGAVINMPILTGGDFGIAGGAKILGNLEVGGKLTTSGASTTIGTSSSPISKLEIFNATNSACSILGHATAAGVGTCDGLHAGAYASSVGTTLDTSTGLPTVDFTAAYNAFDGLTKTGCPALLFDKSAHHMNNDNSANIGALMFGSTDYDCFVGSNELKWNHTTKQLTANGEFFFDGTLTPPAGIGNIVYSGEATFYFTGGVTWNTGSLCGISGCGSNWDTSQNVLFWVADCTGQPGTGCVSISSAGTNVQVGVYADGTYKVSGNAGNMAPVICDTFTITGGSDTLVPILKFPPGTPAPTTSVAYSGTPPTGWSG
jgi:Tfp pilus assembly protein PilX